MPMPLSDLEKLAQPVADAVRVYIRSPGVVQRDKLETELTTALHLAYAKGKADADKPLPEA